MGSGVRGKVSKANWKKKYLELKKEVKQELSTTTIKDAELDKLKEMVLRRHHEWRKPRRNHYWFYLITAILVIGGMYVIIENPLAISKMSIQITFLITVLLGAALVMLFVYDYLNFARDDMENKIENEIIRYRYERPTRR
jgi:hypothetical protein